MPSKTDMAKTATDQTGTSNLFSSDWKPALQIFRMGEQKVQMDPAGQCNVGRLWYRLWPWKVKYLGYYQHEFLLRHFILCTEHGDGKITWGGPNSFSQYCVNWNPLIVVLSRFAQPVCRCMFALKNHIRKKDHLPFRNFESFFFHLWQAPDNRWWAEWGERRTVVGTF